MEIKLGNKVLKVQILPVDTPSLDDTLETLSFALISNTDSMPYAPLQSVTLTTDDNEEICFVLVSDKVDLVSLNPLKYKHTLTCSQNTRLLSKHIVRNSVISQTPRIKEKVYVALPCKLNRLNTSSTFGFIYNNGTEDTNLNDGDGLTISPFKLSQNEKIKNANIYINSMAFYCKAKGTGGDAGKYYTDIAKNYKTLNQLNAYNTSTGSISVDFSNCYIGYTDQNDNFHQIESLANIIPTGNDDNIFNTNINITSIFNGVDLSNAKNITIQMPPYSFLVANGLDATTVGTVAVVLNELSIELETYYYDCYEVLELLLKRQRKSYTPALSPNPQEISEIDLFNLPTDPTDETYIALHSVIAPNFTFTQSTLYDCIAEVFKVFDAIFTMDSNKTLHIEYFNYKQRDLTDTLKKTGVSTAIGEDRYANRFVSNYQDARIDEDFPSGDSFGTIRSNDLGIPSQTDHYFVTPHPIQKINKAEVLITNGVQNSSVIQILNQASPKGFLTYYMEGKVVLDITDYVIEKQIYSQLPVDTWDPTNFRTLKQNNTISYTDGDNKIDIASSFAGWLNITNHNYNCMLASVWGRLNNVNKGVPTIPELAPNWADVRMRVNYTATINGKISVESVEKKINGEIIIDQNNGAVDLNKLGLNALGLQLKTGQPEMNVSVKLTKWANRVKQGDYINLGKDGYWVANVIAYTILDGEYIQQKITFVKNFNALSLRTKLLREKRMSNISRELTQKSEEIITNYIYFMALDKSASTVSISSYWQPSVFASNDIENSMYLSFTNDSSVNLTLTCAIFLCDYQTYPVYIPMVKYGAGNTINFEMEFVSPMNAGNQTTYYTTSTWAGSNKYYTSAVKYTDDNGFLDKCSIYFTKNINNEIFTESFPVIDSVIFLGHYAGGISEYKVYKQPNEIFALNYQLCFLGYDHTKDFVGSAFINDNFFIRSKQFDRKCKLYVSASEKYDILDIKGKGTPVEISSISHNRYIGYSGITFNHTGNELQTDGVSWAICDERDNILFAFNRTFDKADTSKTFYFTDRCERK